MVDRLSPAQARRLRLLVTEPAQIGTEDTELLQAVNKVVRALGIAHDAGKSSEESTLRRRSLGFIGTLDSAGVRGRSPPGEAERLHPT
ncbi:hypothetical protein ACW9HR_21435 [Nocardia gipuzkoensis]